VIFQPSCLRQLLTRRGQEEAGIFVPCHDGVFLMLKKSILIALVLMTGFAFSGGCLGSLWSGQGLGAVGLAALLYQAFGPTITIPVST